MGALASAHDIAEGGLAVALAECCLAGGIGARVELGDGLWEAMSLAAPPRRPGSPLASRMTALFGEGAGGFVVSGRADALRELAARASELGPGVPVVAIGSVGGDALAIVDALTITLTDLGEAHASLAGCSLARSD